MIRLKPALRPALVAVLVAAGGTLGLATAAHAAPAYAPATATTLTLDGAGWRAAGLDVGQGTQLGAQQPGFDDSGWYPAAVPSTSYQLLLARQAIDDPYRHGAGDYHWPGQKEWWYRKHLVVPDAMRDRLVRLHIEGAMENADVYVNGTLVGGTHGMYDETWLDVSRYLHYGAANLVAIRTYPSSGSWTSYPSIAANSTYWKGFQYGQHIRPLGLWRGVELTASGPVYLQDTFVRTAGELTAASTQATLRVTSTVVNTTGSARHVVVHWRLSGSDFTMAPLSGATPATVPPGTHQVSYDVVVRGARLHLWWPNDYGRNLPSGDRYLYKLTTALGGLGNPDSVQVTDDIGIRSLTYRMTAHAGADDYPLEYVVNGEPVYLQGGNWVPSDGLYRADVMSRNYQRDLLLARDAHVRMLRVWGGGIEENREFYALASRYGILILQEFWHFQAAYHPDPAEWLDNAGDIVKRLRNFPAIARYDGGNELTGVVYGDRAAAEALPWVQLVREAYEKYDGTRGDFLGTDPAGGSCHRWDNLHMIGSEGYELAHGAACDFLSELGMNSAPSAATLAGYDGADRAAQLYRMIGEEYVYPNEFGGYQSTDDLVGKSQLAQAIGMSYNMSWAKTYKWTTAGSLVWQLNDMAPMVGWGVIDFDNHPKAAYYYLARAYAPVAITATYDKYYFSPGEAFAVDVHALNDTTRPLAGYTARAELVGLDGTPLGDQRATVTVPANAAGGVLDAFTAHFTAPAARGVFLLHLTLDDPSGRQAASDDVLFTAEPNRSLYTLATAAHPQDLAVRREPGRVTVTNHSDRPAYGVELRPAGDVRLSDNYFTLMPGGSETVTVRDWNGRAADPRVAVTQLGAQPAADNLALGRPTYASRDDYNYRTGTNTHSDRLALYATDGDAMYTAASDYSQWRGQTAGPAWLETDLGSRRTIAQVTVEWGAQHGVDYAIQVSDDARTWRTVRTVSGGDGGTDVLGFAPVAARYVRLAGATSTGEYDVRELQVFAHAVAPPAYQYVPGAVEVERLPDADLGGGASRSVLRSDALSDGAADEIGAVGPGASVGYALASQARSYDVRVGVRTQPRGGILQLSVGGRQLGGAVDTYAAQAGTREIDLGSRTFSSPGTPAFTFTATGKNAASDGYDLGIDYVLLVPLDHVYETEDLPTTTSPGTSHVSFTDAHMSGGAGDKLNADGAGDYVEYRFTVPAAGNYDVSVGVKAQDTRGTFQASVDGSPLGGPHDTYASSDTYTELDLGPHTFATAGTHRIRFTITGKNPASLGYTLGLDYLKLGPPPPPGCAPTDGTWEAECLTATTSPGDSHAPFADAHMSGGTGDKLSADAAGDYIAYRLPVSGPGTYDIHVRVKEQDTRGIFQASIDGQSLGDPCDTYRPSDTYTTVDLGRHTFAIGGSHQLRFTVTGRNPASLGYSLAFDYVQLIPQ